MYWKFRGLRWKCRRKSNAYCLICTIKTKLLIYPIDIHTLPSTSKIMEFNSENKITKYGA